jgi:group II intron reverse transcriptase/maturase
MGLPILQRLESLRKRNLDNKDAVNKDLFRMVCNKDLLTISYNLIKSKPGNMTPGTDNETLDKISEITIENIISQLRDRTFVFKPVRRVHIPKGNTGKTRPLGVPSPRDKIVQKAIALIMENIYEPIFSTHSHGFRPGKSCHTALQDFRKHWTGIKWVIEGDIKGCYDNVNHHILINILRRKIKDERFIQLIWKLIRAGVEENGVREKTKIGTPQGGILSPILANIYLHELDEHLVTLSKEISSASDKDKKRPNPEYKHIQYEINRLKTHGSKGEKVKGKLNKDELIKLKSLGKELRTIPSMDPMDPEYKKILFIRYADDWIIGIIGEKQDAIDIRTKIETYLEQHLKLTLSPEKTKITYLGKRTARFLGYELQSGGTSKFSTSKTLYKRTVGFQPRIFMPISDIVSKMADNNFCTKIGIGTRKKGWIHYPDNIIVQKFNYILRGYRNYYAPSDNFGAGMNRLEYILKFSCAHTLASKRRTRVSIQIKRLIGLGLDIKKEHVNNKWDFKINPFDYNAVFTTYAKRTNLLTSSKCLVCGSTEHLEMHHVKALRKNGVDHLDKHMIGIMQRMQRKQICVCRVCHMDIHNGRYDGRSLSFLEEDELIKL